MPLEEERGVIVAQLAQGIGSMALEFYEFRYFTYKDDDELENYPEGNVSFNIPKNQYVAFGCSLTNLDPRKQTILLDSHSLFWQPRRPGVAEKTWFIVNVDDEGKISSAYSPISTAYGETKLLVFASQNDLGIGSFSRLRTPNVVTNSGHIPSAAWNDRRISLCAKHTFRCALLFLDGYNDIN